MHFCPMLAIGPTVPSFYIDNGILNSNDYDLNRFTLDKSISINWLNQKPERSVIYIPFIGMACLGNKQVKELVWDLKKSSFYLLWIIRDIRKQTSSQKDQPMDAKFVEDVWKVGVRVKVDEGGIVGRDEIERCIREVMEG
ncbi:hypothetical protein CISIN_1g039400mg [Citrus sinensis]|uniref:Uncharacterized protein n=1 Tax=Citrus sinensis TaxID=2711 RepID=A0A067DCP8_CITSI|nr:hypothetical protein CISIN_1g039400mg [Citrus sinensis]